MRGRCQGGRRDRFIGLWLRCLLVCTATTQVEAQAHPIAHASDSAVPDKAAEYAKAIGEAVEHYAARRWRPAHDAFARAHALQPSARTYRGLGLAAFYLDEFAEARAAFEQALVDRRKPLPAEQHRELLDLLRVCARQTGRVELLVTPSSAKVELDGALTDRSVLLLGRGEHVLSVTAEGYVTARRTLLIAGGEERSVVLELQRVEPAVSAPVATPEPVLAPAVASPSAPPPARPADRPNSRVLMWIAAAAMPVFAGAAAAIWFTGKAERNEIERECGRDRCDEAEAIRRSDNANLDAHETWTNVSLAASAISLGTAAVLFFVEGQPSEGAAVELSATGPGAALSGRF